MDEVRPSPVGTKIGKFIIEGELGSGGMANVYLARDPELDRRVALKVLRASTKDDEAHRMRLLREGQAVARVNHPNVVIVHEVGIDGGQVYLAQELVEGETLGAWLSRPHTQREVLEVMIASGRGLAAAHAKGLVHRDFKPENVLLGNDGRVRVSDFGLARSIEAVRVLTAPGKVGIDAMAPTIDDVAKSPMAPLTRTGALMGTPLYMAPEQHLGELTDARTDQFSFCVSLYRALYGTAPFTGATYIALSDAVLRGAIEPPPRGSRVSKRLRGIVCRGLQRDPEDRYPSMEALLTELTEASSARPRRVAMVAAVVIVLGTVGGIALFSGSRDPIDDVATAPSSNGRPTVAVMGFRNLAGNAALAWISPALGELLASELSTGDALHLVSADAANRARVDLELPEAESYSTEMLAAIRKRLGVDVVILGSYLGANGSLTLVATVEDLAGGKTRRIQVSGSEADLPALVMSVGPQIRTALGIQSESAATSAIRGVLPRSPQAARPYIEGLSALRVFDYKLAKERLLAVTEHEPGFAPAHAALADAHAGRYEHEAARAEDAKAVAGASQLPVEQQMLIKARAFTRAGESAKALEQLRRLFALHPDDLETGLLLAAAQQGAAGSTIAALRALPGSAGTDPRIDVLEARIAQTNRDLAKALTLVREAARKARERGAKLVLAAARHLEGVLLADQGDFRGAIAAHEEARRLYEQFGDGLRMVVVLNNLATIHLESGDPEKAFAEYDAVAAFRAEIGQPVWASYGWSAAAFAVALAGRLDEAATKLREAAAVLGPKDLEPRVQLDAMAGFVAHMRGDLATALARTEAARRGYLAAGIADLAALCSQGVAETLVDQGDAVGARARYDEGLELARKAKLSQRSATLELARAWLDLDEGQPEKAAAAAISVQPALAVRGARDDEANAWTIVAAARIAQGKRPEALEALERSKPDAINVFRIRIGRQIVGAKYAAVTGDVARSLEELDRARAESEQSGHLGLAFEARLASAEVQAASEPTAARIAVDSLIKDAQARGYRRIVRRARAIAGR